MRRTLAPSADPAASTTAERTHAAAGTRGDAGGRADGPASLLSLGSVIGNRRLGAALRSGVRVGGVHDAAEREAERAADRVAGRTPSPASVPRTADGGGSTAPPVVHDVLRSAGEPLRPAVRGWMESRFGVDFGGVRVHTGGPAAQSARRLGAAAWTVGPHVAFARGRYQPDTAPGRRLLAHELAHVVQQRSSPPVLRRQPDAAPAPAPAQAQADAAPAPAQADEANLQKLFDQFQKQYNRPPGKRLSQWAREAQQGWGRPLEYAELDGAWQMLRIFNRLPPTRPPEPFKLPPGTVGANELLPFPKGQQIRITQIMDKVLSPAALNFVRSMAENEEKEQVKKGRKPLAELSGMEEVIRTYPLMALNLILSPSVIKNVTGVVEASGPEEVRLAMDVPTIPAEGGRPAIPAFKGTITVEVNAMTVPDFDVTFQWSLGGGRYGLGGLHATREKDGTILVTIPKMTYFKVQVAPGEGGATALQLVDIDWRAKLAMGLREPVKVIDIRPLNAAPGSAAEAAEVRQARAAPPPARTGLETFGGSTLQYGVKDERWRAMMGAGVRMTFRPLGDLLSVPLQFQVDYVPRSSVWAEAATGVQTTLSGDVPVTVRLLAGVRGGSLEAPDGGSGPRIPALGVTGAVGGAVRLSPIVSMQMQAGLFRNLLKDAEDKGPTWVPSVHLGSVIHW